MNSDHYLVRVFFIGGFKKLVLCVLKGAMSQGYCYFRSILYRSHYLTQNAPLEFKNNIKPKVHQGALTIIFLVFFACKALQLKKVGPTFSSLQETTGNSFNA